MSAAAGPGETLDTVLRGRLRLLQPARGARVTMDPLLLADFVGVTKGRVLDLGCGTGVIGLALATASPAAKVVGVELAPALAELARRNAALNGAAMEIVEGDLTRWKALGLAVESFDWVVANPPYQAQGRGRPPSGRERALARSEAACTLADVVAAARRFVSPKGRVAMVLPAARVAELFALLAASGLTARTLRAVHSVATEPARRALVLASRAKPGVELEIKPALVVHGEDRKSYTAEAARILGD